LNAQEKKIQEAILKFFNEKIQNKFPDSDCNFENDFAILSFNYLLLIFYALPFFFPFFIVIFDVYISKDLAKVYLIDFNPFADSTEPLMFDWNELHLWNPKKVRRNSKNCSEQKKK